jgi:hypothetical protein
MARVLINIPRNIRAGETFAVRTLIQHGMESGYRPDGAGGGTVVQAASHSSVLAPTSRSHCTRPRHRGTQTKKFNKFISLDTA